ncbi:uncharacterized protein LACBIDRAFT_321327 [Laccaria bicolor S238N-H82]|uniref:Predicted protein n=1 Tax=Laccaria bicolor (strain S238N-H82 / ATCC MYA-4686) TaxID=486041 RepID=B0CPL9_LACBS|nr:uncharacterized protein LACBIDRAFT_321327 [Laccaria bicolor S238N-H82]EDR15479.1 predicted protein [Laccaria bicolor S238N-H82]|eukprot:XP_001873687.1 predicted protein [Laccaria bicolor S238N-H82]
MSIAHEAEARGIPITDDLFAGVMDFSEAESSGFTRGFIVFWMAQPDNTRNRQELQVAAEHLLKGCREHYCAGVTRVSRISGVISPAMADVFITRALGLLMLPTSAEFTSQALLLVRDFPKLASWMEWWTQPAHVSMLFESERKMDIDLWDSLPADNNTEEAMHWKLYSACGRDHEFLEGMYSPYMLLLYIMNAFMTEQLMNKSIEGKPICYGKAERWKIVKENIGQTKPTCSGKPADKKRKKNDGRLPDTNKELLGTNVKQKQLTLKSFTKKEPEPKKPKPKKPDPKIAESPATSPAVQDLPSYPWFKNSCWLNSSLQLLYTTMCSSVNEFKTIYNSLPENSAIRPVFSHLLEQYDLDKAEKTTSTFLHCQQDSLCTHLKKKKVIETVSGFESLFAWFAELVKLEEVHSSYRPVSAFKTLFIKIHYCTGSSSIGGPHLTPHDFEQFQGDFALYFADWVSLNKEQVPATRCWRVKETVPLCLGAREDICYLLTSLPLLFTIEVGDEHPSETMPQEWDFPSTLLPHTQSAANSHGLVYDLMGLALTNEDGNHFIARYASDNKKVIYTYDDLMNNGHPIRDKPASFDTHVAGKHVDLPQNFVVYQAFYLLRGGAVAQDLFFQVRTAALAKKFNLRFSTNNLDRLFSTTYHLDQFVELESNKRTWLLNPLRSRTLEYVSRDAPADITEESLSPEPEEDLDILHYEWYLNLFIRAGRGALARHEQFWYPVHLIQAVQHGWRVHWWRENQFLDKDEPAAGGFSVVNTKDIVDSLWNDRLARRAIQLGKWKHAQDIETSEDILADPSKIPYSEEINKILSPFKKLLKKLLTCYSPDDLKSEIIPARDWLENSKKPLQTSLVPYCGALSIVKRAQITNWFLCHISKNAETWLGHLPLAHAFTLYTAEHIKNEPKLKVLTQPEIINKAWRIQFTSIPSVLFDIDVECEALENLETEMFEVSRAAGITSYYQWGLDAGHHQDWDPYERMEDLNHQDCPGDDDDLQFGPDYIHREEKIQLTEKNSRPKPCPRMIKKTK